MLHREKNMRISTTTLFPWLAATILPVLAPLASVSAQDQIQDKSADYFKGKDLGYWIEQANSREWFKIKEALEVLLQAGPMAKPATPALLKALDREEVSLLAIQTLVAIGEIPVQALPALKRCLKKKVSSEAAIRALGMMGTAAKPAKRDLIRMTHTRHRSLALRTLPRIGVDPMSVLIKDLQGMKWRTDALKRVVTLGSKASQALPQLLKILATKPKFKSEVFGVRTRAQRLAIERAKQAFLVRRKEAATQRALAAQAIGRMGTPKRALNQLGRNVGDFDAEASKSALWALMFHRDVALSHLTKRVAKKKVPNSAFLMAALRSYGPNAAPALAPLRRKARKSSTDLGRMAGETINAIERSMSYVEDAKSSDPRVRREAVLALLDFGPAATKGVVQALQSNDGALKKSVVQKLAREPARYLAIDDGVALHYPQLPRPRMQPVPFLPFLIEFAQGDDAELAGLAIDALTGIGSPTADRFLPALVQLSEKQTNDADFRISICNALIAFKAIASRSDTYVQSFLPYLASEDGMTAARTLSLLRRLGETASPCVPKLIEWLDGGGSRAETASKALVAIGPATLEALLAALGHDVANRRAWAAFTIGFFGAAAAPAVAALQEAQADDPVAAVKEMAEQALTRIERSRRPSPPRRPSSPGIRRR